MNRKLSLSTLVSIVSALAIGSTLVGCEVGGVGDPCIPEDEYTKGFSGFSVQEVNVESRSFQCLTRICLVNHFQGRVSCPYGTPGSDGNSRAAIPETPPGCTVPDNADQKVTAEVEPQLARRQANDAVYCSCRCDGPDPSARYCECPSGFACRPLVDDLKLGSAQLVGNYCVREGTEYNARTLDNPCRYSAFTSSDPRHCPASGACGDDPRDNGFCGGVDANGAPL